MQNSSPDEHSSESEDELDPWAAAAQKADEQEAEDPWAVEQPAYRTARTMIQFDEEEEEPPPAPPPTPVAEQPAYRSARTIMEFDEEPEPPPPPPPAKRAPSPPSPTFRGARTMIDLADDEPEEAPPPPPQQPSHRNMNTVIDLGEMEPAKVDAPGFFKGVDLVRKSPTLIDQPGTAAPDSAPPSHTAEGQPDEVAGFKILGLLGEGGMGQVYKAWQNSLDREVAIKVLSDALRKNQAFVKRLEAEAKAAARLRHANIVGVIDQGLCPKTGLKFIAMEFVDGQSAGDLLKAMGKLPEPDAVTITLAVAQALACAETYGIVHRDIKPDNILIGSDGIPKLTDLGLAKRMEASREGKRKINFMGTPTYMAPEQVKKPDGVDIRADLYALGTCLFQFVTGRAPFDTSKASTVIREKLAREVPSPQVFEPSVSNDVAQLIAWMCARDPDKRYPTAKDAAKSVNRVLNGKPPLKPVGKGQAISPKAKTVTGVRAGPSALSDDLALGRQPHEPAAPPPEAKKEEEAPATRRIARGRGFYDNLETKEVAEHKVVKTSGTGYYDDMLMGGRRRRKSLEVAPSRVKGRGFYEDDHLLARDWKDEGKEKEEEEAPTMLLSRDGARAYQVGKQLREEPGGTLFAATVQGSRDFGRKGFANDVPRVLVKVAPPTKEGLKHEQIVYSVPDPSLARLIDFGVLQEGRFFLVLEDLQHHPAQQYRHETVGVRVDTATALDTHLNLLETLKRLHFRRNMPVVLCNIRPESIMLRITHSSEDGLTELEYLNHLALGTYQPVFTNLTCAQHRNVLRDAKGKAQIEVSSPLYLPPESVPVPTKDGFRPGKFWVGTDVYALSLVLYVHLTGEYPYAFMGLPELSGKEWYHQVLELKQSHASPIDEKYLEAVVGRAAMDLVDGIKHGIHPDPKKRANPLQLLKRYMKAFKGTEEGPRPKKDFQYDGPDVALRLRQTHFPKLNPDRSPYV